MDSSFFLFLVAAAIGFFMLFRKFRFQQDNKESNSSSLSLPSTPTSVSRNWKHDVFPSFHGADVRRTFLSHIMESFRRKGIDPFIDNNIERSKSIGPELKEAIKGSKIAIVLLSKNYASSSWCLDELAEIMKCRELSGQIVMTIFYEVDPTYIKKQTGDFGKAFRKTCKGKTKEHIKRWRKALKDVATIAGEHSRNWSNEAEMIEKISIDVSNMLNLSIPSSDFDDFVGITAHMERMEKYLSLDLDEVRMIGIWGPPGIGKTTIATCMFDRLSSRFPLAAIMADIRECYPRLCLDERNAQLKLQKQMLSLIFNQKDIMISHLGVAQERLKDKKVLLVLDEVDHSGQLDALAKEIQWFGPGSRIIITTEDLGVLKAHGINHVYKVDFPSNDEAFQIFCMNAFGQKQPYEGFRKLALEVMALAGELPLGLKVLGSALRGMSKPDWERALPRLKTSLDGKIGSIIQFSYDALCDEDKYLFLYIACLFIFETTTKVKELLGKFLDVRQGLYVLAQKSLISIDGETIKMHTLLEQFGRETSRKQFVRHGFTKRQLLVGERDICEVLEDDTIDSRRFIGINLDLSETEEELNISEKALERMHDFQFVRIDGNNHSQHARLLPILEGLIYHSQKIRLLDWSYFQDICLPSTFNPEFLVELTLKYSKLQKLWEGTKQLRNLKWMSLGGSKDLKELPDLSTATNLEEVDLINCSSLVELPSSIGNATKLELLNLSDCSSLVKLPSSIGDITNLKEFDLSNCSSLIELPPSIGTATNLWTLNISGCSSLIELPPSIGTATNLWTLNISGCSSLIELPPSIGTATNLKKLKISGCSSLVKLPSSIGDITNLKEFDLSNCSSLIELPPSIGTATNLWTLNISGCSSLVKLPSSIGDITNLKEFDLSNCSSLIELPPSIGTATNLWTLNISGCSSLIELPPSIGTATNLKKLYISGCSSLVKLPSSIGDITNLKEFDLSNCSSIIELPPSIGTATNLWILNISGCSSLVKLPSSIGDITNLKDFDLSNCSSIIELPPSIGTATNLWILNISGCSSLVKLPSSIGDITNLKEFDLSNCSSIIELPPSIGTATNLWILNISGCSSLVKLPSSIGDITNLKDFDLSNCSSIIELPPSIGTATNLWILNISGCSSLVKLPSSIGDITNLKEFDLSNCSSLIELPPSIGTATNLWTLNISGCSSLVKLPSSIGDITNLKEFDLSNCSSLIELPPSIGTATNLWTLNISGCSSLIELPPSIGTATNLKKLYISGCSSLVKLPSSIGDITNLKEFDLSNCSSIIELPPSIGTATNLWILNISGCSSLVKLPSSIGDITNLKDFDLSNCSSIIELPPSIGTATNLWILNISGCSSLVKLPSSIGDITNLREFDLSNCSSLVKLPSSINAPNLQKLSLSHCSSLVKLPDIENATNLKELILQNCSSLLELPPSIGTATNLKRLNISGCSSLVKLPSSIGDITNLQEFNLSNCSSLVELPSSIGKLQKLSKLRMSGCSKLEALPTNINLESLRTLDLTNCSQLKRFPEISTNIAYLRLTGTAIKEVPLSIMSWSRLDDFGISYFESLKEFPHALDIITELQLNEDIQEVAPWVKGMSRLRKLKLYNCNNLVSLPQLSDSLSYLDADNCQSLERLDCTFNNPDIRLKFSKCFNLNQEARDLIMNTSTFHPAILPGTQVPACFNHLEMLPDTSGGSLTIKLNESPLPTSLRFKACIMLVMGNEETGADQETDDDQETRIGVNINIRDKQKDLPVLCTPSNPDIRPLLTEHIYTFEVETEEVTSTELVFEFKTYLEIPWGSLHDSNWKIKEFGISWRSLHVDERRWDTVRNFNPFSSLSLLSLSVGLCLKFKLIEDKEIYANKDGEDRRRGREEAVETLKFMFLICEMSRD